MNNFIKVVSMAIVFGLSFSSTVFAQEAKVKKLSENVYTISLLHYTSLVVIGEQEILVTDTANPYRATLLRDEIAKLSKKPVGKIILSHEHFDHTGGTEVFSEANVIAHRNIEEFAELDPLNMIPDVIDQTYVDRMVIDMGTTSVELRHMGAADGIASTIVYLPVEKIAASADLYVDDGLNKGLYLSDTNLLGNRKILNEMMSWNLKHAVNAHSNTTDLTPLIATAGFLNDLYEVLMPTVLEGMKTNPAGIIPNIVSTSETLEMPKYKSWTNYKDLPTYVIKMGFAIVHGG